MVVGNIVVGSADRGSASRGIRALAVLAALASLAACSSGDDDLPPPVDQVVLVEPVESGAALTPALNLSARIQAAVGTQLAFQVDGRIARIAVTEGAAVRRGQLLAELDPGDYTLRLREARVAETNAFADLARRRTLQGERILSSATVEQAETQAANARAQREAAQRQVAYTRLRAPYDGRVGQRLVDQGTLVSPTQPVFQMIDANVVEVAADLSEADAQRLPLNRGLRVVGRVAGPAGEVELPLRYHEHTVVPEEQSRTYRLVLRGPRQPGLTLLPGMPVRVTAANPAASPAAEGERVVPVAALLAREDARAVVWVVSRDRHARRIPVTLLGITGDRARVRGNLPEDAAVVVAGGHKLAEGQPVQPRRRV